MDRKDSRKRVSAKHKIGSLQKKYCSKKTAGKRQYGKYKSDQTPDQPAEKSIMDKMPLRISVITVTRVERIILIIIINSPNQIDKSIVTHETSYSQAS